MGGGLASSCVGRVYGADGAVRLVLRAAAWVVFTVRMVPCDWFCRVGGW